MAARYADLFGAAHWTTYLSQIRKSAHGEEDTMVSQAQQGEIDELYIKGNCILSTEAVQHSSSPPEGYGMKLGLLASEANNG